MRVVAMVMLRSCRVGGGRSRHWGLCHRVVIINSWLALSFFLTLSLRLYLLQRLWSLLERMIGLCSLLERMSWVTRGIGRRGRYKLLFSFCCFCWLGLLSRGGDSSLFC